MITHANLADNLTLIVNGLSAVDDTVVVSWLPQVTPSIITCCRTVTILVRL